MISARIKLIHFQLWIFLACFFGFPTSIDAFFFNWFWTRDASQPIQTDGPFKSIPFEYKTEDEKFLEEASKFTDLMKTSSLDVCQHKVILQIKTSCFSMTEEELAKMSVNLLNCQSQVDGRKVFPCTESVSLKDCTKDMDANMWNAYHLMNNRARAVCLAARRTQFQALSEMTVNKLMASAHDQIQKMTNLLEGQEKLESITLGTLHSVEKGHIDLLKQQENLKDAQKTVQDFVAFNLEQLTTEKALIAAGNKELAKMTQTIKEKLDEANQQLSSQSEERAQSQHKLLKDIEALQMQSHDIFQRIDSSTEKLLAQHEAASQSYKVAVDNLVKINDTVHYLLKIINATREELDGRFYWIQGFLDGTGNHIEKLLSTTFHIVYLLVGMLFASFLNFSSTSRILLAIVVPLNMFVTYKRGPETALDFSQMTLFLTSSVIVIAFIHKLYSLFSAKSPPQIYVKNGSKTYQREGESNVSSGSPMKSSKNTAGRSTHYVTYVFRKLTYRLNQLLSFAFGWVGKKSSESSPPSPTRFDEHFNGSSFAEKNDKNGDLNNWNGYSHLRDKYQLSVNNRVNEWLQSKVDYPRSETPSSTASGSRKFYCSAVCLSGRRCKNTPHLGHDVCHRHLSGSSIQ